MGNNSNTERDIIFISKATPGDDSFALWLAPKLEAAGYKVFADIVCLGAGDRWRQKITRTLQDNAVKMVLCCSDETLNREGVQEEIEIALDLSKELDDPNFVIPLKLKPYKKLFGIGGLQYINFENQWAEGLQTLLSEFQKHTVPRVSKGKIQPHWEQYHKRKQVKIEQVPEVLTSNWLRVMSAPDQIAYVEPIGSVTHQKMLRLGKSFQYPVVPYARGFLTFASPFDMVEHFAEVGTFKTTYTFNLEDFLENGSDDPQIRKFDARNKVVDLLRQAWQKLCVSEGFLSYDYSNGVGFHVSKNKIDFGKRISWGRQGERRSNVLRNKAKGKVWEYGVSVNPSLFPYPHLRLKGRVLFSDMEENNKILVIKDKDKQHSLRRTICSSWRNKAWHGRLMAFMELLVGESPYVLMPVGREQHIVADAMPLQFTSPVTALQTNETDEEAEETDLTTIGGYFIAEDE